MGIAAYFLIALLSAEDGGSMVVPKPKHHRARSSRASPADGGSSEAPEDGGPAVAALVAKMQAFYENTADFTAQFRQEYTHQAFRRTQISTGNVTFKKPGMMRWEYLTPSPKTFVLAGERVYALDPEALTLTKASLNTNELSASVTFLWGRGKLEKEFKITRMQCGRCDGVLLRLSPLKPDPRFQEVHLEIDPATGVVLKSTVVDPDGSLNAIAFLGLQRNIGVEDSFFQIAPPENTQVIDLTGDRAKR